VALSPRFPSLYQFNTRVLLREMTPDPRRSASFDEISESFLDSLIFLGFDWVWPMGVWQTGDAARNVSRRNPEWRAGYQKALPDLTDNDISGSPYAIKSYTVNKDFGGDESLARFRQRLKQRGIRLLLDFVPNHVAPDHPWAVEHPEYLIGGSEEDLAREPWNFMRVETPQGVRVIAHGRDPYFAGWPDTIQVNYRSRGLRQAMIDELRKIATRCDGIRCDMAMLPLPDVIERTWGERARPSDGTSPVNESFWPEAVSNVKALHPDFIFMAEVYWDREFDLQQQGFDYTYDKRYYDRLHGRHTEEARGHLGADAEFQRKSVRFLENHDEPRAAGVFPPDVHRAAAIATFLVPGMRFFHEGQLEGRKQHVSMHLSRRPVEPVDADVREFYMQLLAILKRTAVRDGTWHLLDCRPTWSGNTTASQFLGFAWRGTAGDRLLVFVNYGGGSAQCFVKVPWADLGGRHVFLSDLMSEAVFERDGDELIQRGMFLDMPAWHYHVFEVNAK